MHLRSLEPGRWRWFLGALAALLLAMLNKPMVGWIVVVFALEWALIGLRKTLTSPRVYLVGAVCAAFALLTLWTTKETFLLEESPLPIFGDPVARAALGLWIYLRNFVAPLGWLSFWYPPEINTGWTHPAVWAGVLATLAAAAAALLAARRAPWRGVAVGLAWFWGMWLPVSGLVGARVLAAQDRYMYQPLVGLLLVIGVALARWARSRPSAAAARAGLAAGVALLLGAAALPSDRRMCWDARSTVERAKRAATQHPSDPRVLEFLGASYDFCRDHPTLESPEPDFARFKNAAAETYRASAALAEEHPEYFPTPRSRAEFHRRLSVYFWKLDLYEEALAQARRAYDFEPDDVNTWVRLAHAYQSLGRWPEALQAYERIAQLLPPDDPTRSSRCLEFGDLLLNHFDEPARALEKFRQALAHPGNLPHYAQRLAILGAARCEVLAGTGSDGYELAMQVFQADQDDLEAARIIALYRLRSHHWEDADRAYRAILATYPDDYEALRGFENVCLNSGDWHSALTAWQKACNQKPDNLVFRSHLVWAAACAGDEQAGALADALISEQPDNRFGCLARMLLALRADDLDAAHAWLLRAQNGPELPLAREFVRAQATLGKMIARGELAPHAVVLQADLCMQIGDLDHGRALIEGYLKAESQPAWRDLAGRILAQKLERPAKSSPAP